MYTEGYIKVKVSDIGNLFLSEEALKFESSAFAFDFNPSEA